jgi:hypothetical protein
LFDIVCHDRRASDPRAEFFIGQRLGSLFLAAGGFVIVIIPATVFSGSSFRQVMCVGKLPSIDSGPPVLTVLGLCVFDGGHHGHLSFIGCFKSA